MAVIRHGPAPEDHYSLISNDLARDPKISLQAKGIYLFLRSHREGWAMSTERIGEALGITRQTVSKYVRELEEAGYLIREQSREEGGEMGGSVYTVLSSPLLKSPTTVFTDNGEFLQHKKTNSFKKNNNHKKTTNTRVIEADWRPPPEQWHKLEEKHKQIDLDSELEKFRSWHIEKQSSYKDWSRAFDNWLKKARPRRPTQKLFDDVPESRPWLEAAPF